MSNTIRDLNPTLGDIVREMVKQALKSDDLSFTVPVKYIFKNLNGGLPNDSCPEDFKAGGKYSIGKLKASYVCNTASRMQEIKDADKRARFSLGEMCFNDEPNYCARITLVDGAVKTGTKAKNDNQLAIKAVEEFRSRLLKLSPSVAGMSGEELKGAVAMINAYQEMIKEAK